MPQQNNTANKPQSKSDNCAPMPVTPTAGSDLQCSAKRSRSDLRHQIADKFLHGRGIFTLLRSSVSSQISSWTDMGIAFAMFAWVLRPMGTDPLRQFIATAVGLIVGGIVNCCINYKFTFQADNCSVKAVALKFFLIWAGSFILNLSGTTVLTHALQSVQWLHEIGVKDDGFFAFSRLSVSLVVSLAWNFLLQKNFVYVQTRFDSYAIRIIDTLTFNRHRTPKP